MLFVQIYMLLVQTCMLFAWIYLLPARKLSLRYRRTLIPS